MEASSNPFASVRQELRSQEDDIRRGVFGRALRNVVQSSTEKKFLWCSEIDAETISKRGKKGALTTISEPQIGVKRERSPETDTKPKYLESSEEASRYIGSFLHSQVEKTIGATLNSLSPGTLRVLCSILGKPTKSRSKETLYNTLASFYYTHCEVLGKRVSRSTVADKQTAEDCKSLNLLLGPRQSKSKASPPSASEPEECDITPSVKVYPQEKKIAHTQPSSIVQSTAPLRQRCNAESQKTVETVVMYPQATFSPAGPSPAAPCRASSPQVAEEWPSQKLEKSIATIIRNYDPVTTSIVVKKLAKIGFSPPDVQSKVEMVLQSFHHKKYIHYENGIAYCLD